MQLHRFHGGIHFAEQENPALAHTITQMPLAKELKFSLQCNSHPPLRPLVSIGDKVTIGQILAVATDEKSTPLLASANGTVTQCDDIIVLETQTDTALRLEDLHKLDDVHRLHRLGVNGLGGAAFSTSGKLRSNANNPIHTLIINAAECEPVICCDQAVIREHADEIVAGIIRLIKLLGAERCFVGIEDSMPVETNKLREAIRAARETPSNDTSNNFLNRIDIVEIPTIYPTGGEKQLINVLTGIALKPQQRPASSGILCFNVSTTLAIKQALIDQHPQLDRVVTVAGDAVTTPQNIRVRLGTPIVTLLQHLGLAYNQQLYIIHGGPLTGREIDAFTTSVSAATNCILVNHRKASPHTRACIRCGKCDLVCPANLLPQQLHWYCQTDNTDDAEKFHLSACIECGCCDYVCPSKIALTEQFRQAKYLALKKERAATLASQAKARFEARAIRLQRKEEQRLQKIENRKRALQAKRQSPPGSNANE